MRMLDTAEHAHSNLAACLSVRGYGVSDFAVFGLSGAFVFLMVSV